MKLSIRRSLFFRYSSICTISTLYEEPIQFEHPNPYLKKLSSQVPCVWNASQRINPVCSAFIQKHSNIETWLRVMQNSCKRIRFGSVLPNERYLVLRVTCHEVHYVSPTSSKRRLFEIPRQAKWLRFLVSVDETLKSWLLLVTGELTGELLSSSSWLWI